MKTYLKATAGSIRRITAIVQHAIITFLCVDLPKLLAMFAIVFLGFLIVLFIAIRPPSRTEKVDPTIAELATNPETYLSKSPLSEEYITVYGAVQSRDLKPTSVTYDFTILKVSTDKDGTNEDQFTSKQYTGKKLTFTDRNGASIAVFVPKGVEVLNIATCLTGLWLQDREGNYIFLVKDTC